MTETEREEKRARIQKNQKEMAVKSEELRNSIMLAAETSFQFKFAMFELQPAEANLLADALVTLMTRDKLIDIELIPIDIHPEENERVEFQLPDHISKSIDEQLVKFNENHLKKILNRYIELRNDNEVEAAKIALGALSDNAITRDAIFLLYNMAATMSTDIIESEMFYPLLGIDA